MRGASGVFESRDSRTRNRWMICVYDICVELLLTPFW